MNVPDRYHLTEELREENRRIRIFRFMTDLTYQRLCLERMTVLEAREAVAELRAVAVRMFPDRHFVFDLVIAPRMERVIHERFGEGYTETQNYS